jgi:hypothetical protein
MRKLSVLVFVMVFVSACGGGTDSTGATNTAPDTVAGASEPAGGATFSGTFATEPGAGPGEISFVLDGEGKRIVSAIINPALNEFACPTGVVISGGGISGTYTPGIAIEGGAFDGEGFGGSFDSSTEAHGTYSLQNSFDCPYELTWTATSE